jgi:hypothetical protein
MTTNVKSRLTRFLATGLTGALALALGLAMLPEPLDQEALNSGAGAGSIVLIALGGVAAFFGLAGAMAVAGGMRFVRGFSLLLAVCWIGLVSFIASTGEIASVTGRRNRVSRTIYWDNEPVGYIVTVAFLALVGLVFIGGVHVALSRWTQGSRKPQPDEPPAGGTAQDKTSVLRAQAQAGDPNALQALMLAARQGDVKAQMEMGAFHHLGQGTVQDDAQAVRWFRMAADQGFVYAQYNMGRMYADGLGVPQDHAEAGRWYRAALVQGSPAACLALALLHAGGSGVVPSKAAAWALASLVSDAGPQAPQYDAALTLCKTLSGQMTPAQTEAALALAREMNGTGRALPALDKYLSRRAAWE